MNKKNTNSVSILPSSIFLFIIIITLLMAIALGLFILLYEPCRSQLDTLSWCIVGFCNGFCPLLVIVAGARRGLSVIKIDENGIKLKIFGFIKFLEMKWDSIAEIRYYERFVPFIFISKTKNLEAKTYDYIIRQKDVIQLQLTKKVYDVLKKYAKQPIIGLTNEKLTALKLK